MDDRSFLHDGEKLLCSVRPSPAALILSLCRGVLDIVVISIILIAIAFGVLSSQSALDWMQAVGILLVLVTTVFVFWRRWHLWHRSSFRITSERILLAFSPSLLHLPLKTVKWPQYQESYTATRTPLDLLFGARPLCIRYGAADGDLTARFPSVRWAEDLKHYMDKVDSAFRHNQTDILKPFVEKTRGHRDLSQLEGKNESERAH